MSRATIIDGKRVAARVRAEVKADVERYVVEHGEPPGLATVLVGDDQASQIYVSGKQKAAQRQASGRLGTSCPQLSRATSSGRSSASSTMHRRSMESSSSFRFHRASTRAR
jgi:hypothetical protein